MKIEKKWIGLAIATIPVIWLILPTDIPAAQSIPEPNTHSQENYQKPLKPTTIASPVIIETEPQKGVSLKLDNMARIVIDKNWEIKQAAMRAQLADENAKAKANANQASSVEMGLPIPQINQATPQSEDLPVTSSTTSDDELRLLKLRLASLITAASGKTFAYLSYNNASPIQVPENGQIAGIKISNITSNGITASLGKQTRRLTMGGQ